MKRVVAALVLLASTSSLTAQADAVPTGDAKGGRALFLQFCATCHGMEGRGDGPMAPILRVLPADLTGLSRRNGGVFPVTAVVRQIDGRDPVLAHGGVMPLFGEFFEGEDGALKAETGQPVMTSRSIVDLTAYLLQIQE